MNDPFNTIGVATNQGSDARLQAVPALQNPYDQQADPILARAWIAGWMKTDHALRTHKDR